MGAQHPEILLAIDREGGTSFGREFYCAAGTSDVKNYITMVAHESTTPIVKRVISRSELTKDFSRPRHKAGPAV